MTSPIKQYKIWCSSENKYIYQWSSNPITKCPNNDAHNVTTIDYIEQSEHVFTRLLSEYRESTVFTLESKQFSIPSGKSLNYYDILFPVSISLCNLTIYANNNNVGDTIELRFLQNTIVGTITQDINAQDTWIYVDNTCLSNVYVGYDFTISDGINTEDLGPIAFIDVDNSKLKCTKSPINNYSSTSGNAIIKTYVKLINNFFIGYVGTTSITNALSHNRYIPANTAIKLIYTNTNVQVAKTLQFNFEYQY